MTEHRTLLRLQALFCAALSCSLHLAGNPGRGKPGDRWSSSRWAASWVATLTPWRRRSTATS